MRSFIPLVLLSLAACGSNTPYTGGAGDRLPEGESLWEGTLTRSGVTSPVYVELQNEGGVLTGTLDTRDDGGSTLVRSSFSGTYDPRSQRIAVAPDEWLDQADGFELAGFSGVWTPEEGHITGTLADAVTGNENTSHGGPVTLRIQSAEGAPTEEGDGANALPTGTHNLSGRFKCASAERPITGTISHDGEGSVTAELTFAEEDLASPIGTIAFTGVHNPDTGGLTLLPGLWTAFSSSVNYATFYVDGRYSPGDGRFVADTRITAGGCLEQLFVVTIE